MNPKTQYFFTEKDLKQNKLEIAASNLSISDLKALENARASSAQKGALHSFKRFFKKDKEKLERFIEINLVDSAGGKTKRNI